MVNKAKPPLTTTHFSVSALARSLLAATVVIALTVPAQGQQTEMEAAAFRLGQRITKSRKNKVVVARFVFEQRGSLVLGRLLAQEFAAALAKTDQDMQVIDRAHLIPILKQRHLQGIDSEIPSIIVSLAPLAGAKAVVTGNLRDYGEFLLLSLKVLEASTEKVLAEEKAWISKTQPMRELQDAPVRDADSGAYLPGVGGVGSLQCRKCPDPYFPDRARSKVSQAKVILRMTVTADGRASDIAILRGAGHRLDENSVDTVRQWEFDPARLPDGTPVPARVTVEVEYRTLPRQ